ncbi:hypothetical protein MRX96_028525 [Rhipicephalus microplus]
MKPSQVFCGRVTTTPVAKCLEALRRVGYSRKKRVRPPPTERTPYAELDTHKESVCPTFHCRVAKLRCSGCIEAESTDYA